MSHFLKLGFRKPTRPDSWKIYHYTAPVVIIFQANQYRILMELNLRHLLDAKSKPPKNFFNQWHKEVYLQGFRALNLSTTFQKHQISTEFGHRFQQFTKLTAPLQNLQLRDLVRTYFEARNPSRVETRSRNPFRDVTQSQNQRKVPPLNRHPLQAYLSDSVRADFDRP